MSAPEQHEPGPRPATAVEERTIVKPMLQDRMKDNETWYLVSSNWFNSWKRFVDFENMGRTYNDPGPIDSTDLMTQGVLRKNLCEVLSYTLLSERCWRTLLHWYGGGPEIARNVILTGFAKRAVVEVYPLNLRVLKSSDLTKEELGTFSKTCTVSAFRQTMCERMGLDPEKVRVWNYFSGFKFKLCSVLSATLDDVMVDEGQQMLLEEQGPDGTYDGHIATPTPVSTVPAISYTSNTSSGTYGRSARDNYDSYYSNTYSSEKSVERGLTGLYNLGNTCFMNSGLQCLSNTVPLQHFFTSDAFLNQINRTNPLGMKGELATEFGALLKQLWAGNRSSIAPREFKYTLGKFEPSFVGYQQHDCQELLAFLLDGLHEDLNRVIEKPPTAPVEANGRPDDVVADETWNTYKLRNNSIIVDLFQGQFKSTVTCPTCHRVSVTFDPFMYLSLPLPFNNKRLVVATFHFLNPAQPITRYGVTVPKFAPVGQVKDLLAALTGVPQANMLACQVYYHRFHKIFSDQETIEDLRDDDTLSVFEVPQDMTSYKKYSLSNSTWVITFVHRVMKSQASYGSAYSYRATVGHPFLLVVPPGGLTPSELLDRVRTYLQPFIKPEEPAFAEVAAPFNLVLEDSYSSRGELTLRDGCVVALDWNTNDYEKYYDENVGKGVLHPSAEPVANETDRQVTLEQCLELFMTEDILSKDDAWYCSACSEFREASKKFDLWRLPEILVVHLKRFAYTRYYRDRLDTVVRFPLRGLDLTQFVKGTHTGVYDLYAISNHMGGMAGGHYTAFCLNDTTKRWYQFDDGNVSPIDDERFLCGTASYVLFYKRRNPGEEMGGEEHHTTATEEEHHTTNGHAEMDADDSK